MRPLRAIQALLTVLPILTAGLYLLGLCTHIGYLSDFGLEYSFAPLPNDIALFSGFISVVTMSFPGVLYVLLMAVSYMALVIIVVILVSSRRVRVVGQRIATWSNRKRPAPIDSPVANGLIDKGGIAAMYCCGYIFVLLLLLLISLFADQIGRERAEKQREDFAAGKFTAYRVLSGQLPQDYVGTLVACGDKYCAFWSKAGTVILKHEAIDSMVAITPPKEAHGKKP